MMIRLMLSLAIAVTAAALAIGAHAGGDEARETARWTKPLTRWHIDALAPNRVLLVERRVGICCLADDTRRIEIVDVNGNKLVTNSTTWQSIDVSRHVPREARAVRLRFKAIISKGGQDGLATVYAFVRAHGASCCPTPANAPGRPVDVELPGGRKTETVMHAVTQHSWTGVREWSEVDVPVKNGRFEWAWGYRRVGGDWPTGDAVGFNLFLNGYAS